MQDPERREVETPVERREVGPPAGRREVGPPVGRREVGPPVGRRWLPALAFGFGTGVLVGFAVIGLVAGPLFLWARATEPAVGLQRPFVRDGLRAAPLAGLAAFAATTVLAGRWRLRHPPR